MRRPGGVLLGLAVLALALARCGSDSPGPAVPGAPSGLTATAVSSARIDLSWTDNATNEEGFRIERCDGASCTVFADVGSAAAGATASQNSGLTAGTRYTYRVRAYNAAGQSAPSNTASATTEPLAPPVTPPAAPSELAATVVSGTRIDLTWTDNSTDEDGFAIERCSGAGCTAFAPAASVGANATSYQNSGLSGGTIYRYRVRALNGAGFSGYSNIVTATTDDAVPAAPTLTGGAASSSTAITIYWADHSTNETGFKIERCTGAGCASFSQIATTAANVTAFQNTGLTASTSYTYRVRAYNAAGNSAYSDTAIIVTHAASVPPAAPSDLVATAISGTRIDLSWTDHAANENGFLIERAAGGGAFSQIATVGANTISFHNTTGLTAGTSYAYRVRAYNGTGTSPYSNTATAATFAPLSPPTLNSPAVSGSSITLTWSFTWPGGLASSQDGYILEQSTTSSTSGFTQVFSVASRTSPYTHTLTNRAPGTYYYRVRAVTTQGTSPNSTVRSAVVAAQATPKIAVTNQLDGGGGNQVLRFRVASSVALLTSAANTAAERLSPDSYCGSLPGDAISPGQTREFDVTGFAPDYYVYIGLGRWDNSDGGGGTTCWYKKNWAADANFNLLYIYAAIVNTDHVGTVQWTLTYSGQNLVLRTPSGDIPFVVSVNQDPIR
ncbi:MAG: fibronectin type III domain-containing protein [Gemmatimonadales bacterium]